MIPNLVPPIALVVMLQLPDRDEAQHWANLAIQFGATPEQLADAWANWDRAHQPLAVAR